MLPSLAIGRTSVGIPYVKRLYWRSVRVPSTIAIVAIAQNVSLRHDSIEKSIENGVDKQSIQYPLPPWTRIRALPFLFKAIANTDSDIRTNALLRQR